MQPPFPAYEGTGHYIFVCYSHRDRETVYAEMQRMAADGVNVWYDEGIQPDVEWTADVAQAINGCAQFLFFVSNDSVRSKHCRRELHYALSRDKHVTVIYLEPTELPDGLELQIGLTQAIHKHNLSDEDYQRKTGAALRRLRRDRKRSRWLTATAAAAVVALAAALGWLYGGDLREAPTEGDVIHVAVLPFKNNSGDPAQNYVGDAMSEEIWNRLSGLPTLRLIAMTSARAAINQELNVRQIADTLDVSYLVEGSVNRAGDQARVSVRLIDAQQGGDLWSNRFDRNVGSVSGIFSLYDEISTGVASAFNLVLGSGPTASAQRPDDVLAYNYIEQAWYKFRNARFDQVEALIDRALEADPNYARAHNMKGWWVRNKTDAGNILPAAAGYAEARRYVERALVLDSGYAPAYIVLGGLHMRMELDFRLAMQAYQQAEALGVKLSLQVADKASLLYLAGRLEEALVLYEAAAAQDPLFITQRIEAVPVLNELGRHDDARALIEELIALAPDHQGLVRFLVRNEATYGDLARARALMDESGLEWDGVPTYIAMREGDPTRFREWVERAAQAPDPHPWQLADWFWLLDDYDEHLRWSTAGLDEAIALHRLPVSLRTKTGYWEKLNDWALSDPDWREQRLARVAAHRARIEKLTARMVL